MLLTRHLNRYKPAILRLPASRPLSPVQLQIEDFLMERSGLLEMFYAPHNEYLNSSASVVIVGITPGMTQMRLSYEAAQAALREGLSDEEVCRSAKDAAGLAGSMRRNLIVMLDELGLQRHLNLSSCGDLFRTHRHLLHTTSVLRFPVFVGGKNYTGSVPALMAYEYLRTKAVTFLKDELRRLRRPLLIPLGKAVENVLRVLEHKGVVDGRLCLWGFPHPSGANGHRRRQFAANLDGMQRIVSSFPATPGPSMSSE